MFKDDGVPDAFEVKVVKELKMLGVDRAELLFDEDAIVSEQYVKASGKVRHNISTYRDTTSKIRSLKIFDGQSDDEVIKQLIHHYLEGVDVHLKKPLDVIRSDWTD